jgi:formamidopyrimidine-DNA glycosylase
MPELPDIELYLHALRPRIVGQRLERVRITSPALLRTTTPPVAELTGRGVRHVRRLGKRIVLGFDAEYFAVLHLMIAGRLHWKAAPAPAPAHPSGPPVPIPQRRGLAAFDFALGTLLLTEAGVKHRASLHLVHGATALAAHDRGGLDVLSASHEQFRATLTRESHTVKRALTDPHLFDGIGNAYSDEILHAARLSPLRLTSQLADDEIERLWRATRETLTHWIERLRAETGNEFPEKVTAFRAGMAVHGRYRQPCPVCGSPVQRIRYAENEVNYCATCQTGGRVLADRSLSRLLRQDWPRSLEEWSEHVGLPEPD